VWMYVSLSLFKFLSLNVCVLLSRVCFSSWMWVSLLNLAFDFDQAKENNVSRVTDRLWN